VPHLLLGVRFLTGGLPARDPAPGAMPICPSATPISDSSLEIDRGSLKRHM
jgi:hypothetical protein